MTQTDASNHSEQIRLFKFRRVTERLYESIENSTLWCSKPSRLNDPFDCQLDLMNSWKRAAARATGKQKEWMNAPMETMAFIHAWPIQFENVGVLSLTSEQLNPLMWSHYADEHRGVCLLYQFSPAFVEEPTSGIIGLAEVKYSADALTDWLLEHQCTSFQDFIQQLIPVYLTAKDPAWAYEKEVRLVTFAEGELKMPPRSLAQVCFGMRTPTTEIDRIMKLASEHGGCGSFCQIKRSQSHDFGITAVPL
ncbi:DUF2971 domain-containing protein [Ralstonia insidiosa]|uniref:DUF2971 domain-containing protein n=1 Tax=Ralstonia insidiosa TaxID=190721 RepID=A0A848P8J8_9RALS|nr:DUF2971 domain-containing protein [Ralstonia insidiosa]NMV41503.1 DUF2971 domain-containing protein [Ralstonia insidiosa]